MSKHGSVLWPCDRGTRAKLEVLQRYLGAWFNILAQRGIKDVIYFDGFCGPGEHEGGEKGSPVVAVQLANAVAQKITDYKVHIILVDKRTSCLQHLKSLEPIRHHHPNVSIDIRKGEFGREIVDIFSNHTYPQNWPMFSFVDPFGFSEFSPQTLRLLMRNQSSEVFVNLWCGFMNRFLTHPDENVQKCIGDLIGHENLDKVRESTDGISEICDLFHTQLEKLGPFVRRFMMRDENNTRDNALFFCGRNERGLEKIKEAMWKVDPIHGAGFSDYAAQKQSSSDLFQGLIEPQSFPLRRILIDRFTGKTGN